MAEETTGDRGLSETFRQVLWQPRAFFERAHPFQTTVPAVLVRALASGLTGVGSAAMLGAIHWPESARSLGYLFGATGGALTAGAVVSVPLLYLRAGLLHALARFVGARRQFAVTRDICGYAMAPAVFGIVPFLGLVAVPWNWLLTASALGTNYRVGRFRWLAAVIGVDLAIYAAMPSPGDWFQIAEVASESMVPTVGPGHRVFISKLSYWLSSPDRGDIIVYEVRNHDGSMGTEISRVVGLPGESLQVEGDGLVIDDQPVPMCSVKMPGRSGSVPFNEVRHLFIEKLPGRRHWLGFRFQPLRRGTSERYLVGEDEVMIAGDMRDWRGVWPTPVKLSRIVGKVWWAHDRSGTPLPHVSSEPRLKELAPENVGEVSDCFEAPEVEVERSSSAIAPSAETPAAPSPPRPAPTPLVPAPAPLAPDKVKRSSSPALIPEPLSGAREAVPSESNDDVLHPGESIEVREPLPTPDGPEGRDGQRP